MGNSYFEFGATASDAEDGPLTNINILGVDAINTNFVATYNVQYSVTDVDGNTTTLVRTIEVIDTTPPSINLNGNSIISIEVGTTYNELGATASDNYDDDNTITSSIVISGSVNTAALGSYTVSYDERTYKITITSSQFFQLFTLDFSNHSQTGKLLGYLPSMV